MAPTAKRSPVRLLRGGLTHLLEIQKVHRSEISRLMSVYTCYILLIVSSRQRPFPAPREVPQAPSRSHPPTKGAPVRSGALMSFTRFVLSANRAVDVCTLLHWFLSLSMMSETHRYVHGAVHHCFVFPCSVALYRLTKPDLSISLMMSVEGVSFFVPCEFSCYALNVPASCFVDMYPLLLGINLGVELWLGGPRVGMCPALVTPLMVLQSG